MTDELKKKLEPLKELCKKYSIRQLGTFREDPIFRHKPSEIMHGGFYEEHCVFKEDKDTEK